MGKWPFKFDFFFRSLILTASSSASNVSGFELEIFLDNLHYHYFIFQKNLNFKNFSKKRMNFAEFSGLLNKSK